MRCFQDENQARGFMVKVLLPAAWKPLLMRHTLAILLLIFLLLVASTDATAGEAAATAKSVSLFNGKDFTGWQQEGHAHWEVHDGILIGRQGPHQAAGDLLTEDAFDDFELTVTFKIVWPANSGVWYRYRSAQEAYQADILEYQSPLAYTGSLYRPGKMFLAVNEDPKLVHRQGWNELVIRATGNRHQIFLNGKQTADVRDDGPRQGRIGFQVHQGSQFSKMRILVKEVRIRKLAR